MAAKAFTGLAACLLLATLATPASAELSDPPYFNLWTAGVEHGSGLLGDNTTVELCGTAACDSGGGVDAINYGIFSVVPTNSGAGSGHIDPFLRFQHNEGDANGSNPTEAAFNTGLFTPPGGPGGDVGTITSDPDNYTGANQAKDASGTHFNHVVKLSDLMAEDGLYSFLLDINEPGADKSTLRVDELALFLSTDAEMKDFLRDEPFKNNGNPNIATSCFTNGTSCLAANQVQKVWDMDFNALSTGGTQKGGANIGGLNINNENDSGKAGSGDYDMKLQLSSTLFDNALSALGVGADQAYVYLYNYMGEAQSKNACTPAGDCETEAEAGFEEWAAVVSTAPPPPPPGVPEPGTALLVVGGLLGMLRARRSAGQPQA